MSVLLQNLLDLRRVLLLDEELLQIVVVQFHLCALLVIHGVVVYEVVRVYGCALQLSSV